MLPNSMLCAPQGSTCHTTLSMSAHSSFSLLDWKLLLAGHFICICWVFLSPPTHTHTLSQTYSLPAPPLCSIQKLASSGLQLARMPSAFQFDFNGGGQELAREREKGKKGRSGHIPMAPSPQGCLKMDVSLLVNLKGTFQQDSLPWVSVTVSTLFRSGLDGITVTLPFLAWGTTASPAGPHICLCE